MPPSRHSPQRQTLRFCKAFFEVHDVEQTRECLLAAGALELVGPIEPAANGDLWYRWEGPGGQHGTHPVSFLIRMRSSRLVLEGPTAVAVGYGWRALDEHLRPHARARVASGDDLARFLPRQRAHSADRPESWSREHEARVLREFYAGFCNRWAHQPHPQLQGRSPAQAAGDPALRTQLERLLARMERVEQERRVRNMPSISVAELRQAVMSSPGEKL